MQAKSSQYAKRYGVSEHTFYKSTGKSGITPVSPPNLADLSEEDRGRWNKYAEYQRKDMSSYTSWELKDVGALVKENVETDGLAFCSVHRFFRKGRWGKAKNDIEIGEGFKGKWNGANPLVWEAMLPCIKLASLIWVNTHHFKWMDALWSGKRVQVPNDEVQDEFGGPPDLAFAFFPRDAPMRETARPSPHLESWINSFPINFGFLDGFKSGRSLNGLTTTGWDATKGYPEGFHVNIAWQNVIPLLRENTTSSERLAQQFFVAKTLIHESCHVMTTLSADAIPGSACPLPEPFYQNESMSEAGWSNEQAIWGGNITAIVPRRMSPKNPHIRPVMALERTNFPNFKEHFKEGKCRAGKPNKKGTIIHDYKRYRHHAAMRADKSERTSWAIPVYWLQNIQTEAYWAHAVANYHGPALRPPSIMGRVTYRSKKNESKIMVGRDYTAFIETKGNTIRARSLNLPDPEKADDETFWWEARRKVRGYAIAVAERQKAGWKFKWKDRKGMLERESHLGAFGDDGVDSDEEASPRLDKPATPPVPVKLPSGSGSTVKEENGKVKPVVLMPNTPPATPVPIRATLESEHEEVLPDDLSEISDDRRKESMVQRARGILFWFLLLGKRAGAKPLPKARGMKRGAGDVGEYEDLETDEEEEEDERPAKKVRFI